MKFDVQDVLLIVGVLSLIVGVGAWSIPASAIVFGIICLLLVVQIERSKKVKEGERNNGSTHK